MDTNSTETFVEENVTLHRVKFWLLLLLQVPAIVLSLIIFTFLIKNRAVLRAPQNHVFLVLLVVSFIQLVFDLPLPIRFYQFGYVSPATPTYCTWWTFFELTLCATSEVLVATMSVQRHMFILNGHILHIRWKRIVFHNLPLVICLIYPITFYAFDILLYPCDNSPWDYTNNLCGTADCYLIYDAVLGTYDWLANNGLPMVIDMLANAVLIVRVIKQKRSRQQPMSWRQQRHMTIQLFCISSLYIIGWGPCLVVGVVQIFISPDFLADIQSDYFIDFVYVVCLFLPWMCLGLFPGLQKWMKELYRDRQPHNVVAPTHETHRRTAV